MPLTAVAGALEVLKRGEAGENEFYGMLVEDAKSKQTSYVNFLCNIHRHIAAHMKR